MCNAWFEIYEKLPEIYCAQCGTKIHLKTRDISESLEPVSDSDVGHTEKICPSCGKSCSIFAEVCWSCNSPLPGVETVIEEKRTEPDYSAIVEKPTEKSEKFDITDINICPLCNTPITKKNEAYICSICNSQFCSLCPPPHIPPDETKLEARVTYSYRFYQVAQWTNDVAKFYETLPSPLCSNCYHQEFEKAIQRFKTKIKLWRVELQKEEMVKVLKEEFPESRSIKPKADEKQIATEAAREFLKKIRIDEE